MEQTTKLDSEVPLHPLVCLLLLVLIIIIIVLYCYIFHHSSCSTSSLPRSTFHMLDQTHTPQMTLIGKLDYSDFKCSCMYTRVTIGRPRGCNHRHDGTTGHSDSTLTTGFARYTRHISYYFEPQPLYCNNNNYWSSHSIRSSTSASRRCTHVASAVRSA